MTNGSETGMIFNLQKFSLHDGPGIRTVVFLKGCPLRCKWCSNPESQFAGSQLLWDSARCLRCGGCAALCSEQAISFTGSAVRISVDRCRACGVCARSCPGQALKLEGERRTADSIVEECLQDLDFYEESSGGVTLSGGEPLLQPEFSAALLKALKSKGIHTAMETTGCVPSQIFQSVSPYLDLLLFDIKHWDGDRHREGTGRSNRLPLENMQSAIRAGKKVLPRLPVIPGYNDSLKDAAGFSSRLKEAGAQEVQLLPFHQFGERKYEMLGQAYSYADTAALQEEDLQEFRQAFLNEGIHAFF